MTKVHFAQLGILVVGLAVLAGFATPWPWPLLIAALGGICLSQGIIMDIVDSTCGIGLYIKYLGQIRKRHARISAEMHRPLLCTEALDYYDRESIPSDALRKRYNLLMRCLRESHDLLQSEQELLDEAVSFLWRGTRACLPARQSFALQVEMEERVQLLLAEEKAIGYSASNLLNEVNLGWWSPCDCTHDLVHLAAQFKDYVDREFPKFEAAVAEEAKKSPNRQILDAKATARSA